MNEAIVFLKKLTEPLLLVGNGFLLLLAAAAPTQAQISGDEILSTPNFTLNVCSQAKDNFFSSYGKFSIAEIATTEGKALNNSLNTDSKNEIDQRLKVLLNLDNELNIKSDTLVSTACNCMYLPGIPGRLILIGGRYMCRFCPVPY